MERLDEETGITQFELERSELSLQKHIQLQIEGERDICSDHINDVRAEATNLTAKDWEERKEAWELKMYAYVMQSVKGLSAELGIELDICGLETSITIGDYLCEIEQEGDLESLTQENLMMHNPLYVDLTRQVHEEIADEILDAFGNYFALYWNFEQSLEYDGDYLDRILFVLPLEEVQEICSS